MSQNRIARRKAITLLDRLIGDLADAESALSKRLEAQLLAAAGLKLSTRPMQLERLNSVYPRRLGDQSADRLLLANLAHWTLVEGRAPGRFEDLTKHARMVGSPAELARHVAERAIADGQLLAEEGSDSDLLYLPIAALCHAELPYRSERWLDEALEDARRRGSILGYTLASAFQAQVAYRQGRLANAEAHAGERRQQYPRRRSGRAHQHSDRTRTAGRGPTHARLVPAPT